MPLITEITQKVFNSETIDRGSLVYARHQSWEEGKGGFVTAISEKEISIQYYSGIGSIKNHFTISSEDIGQWEIRWSKDLLLIEDNMEERI